MQIDIGITPPDSFWKGGVEHRWELGRRIVDSGIDHIFFADHVSFRVGAGQDGMVQAAATAMAHPTVGVYLGVYLLPLRHPVPVARQLSTLSEVAPGRITFGVGVGGEDRHEIEVCGVDPATRGRRTDEALEIVRGLLEGQTVTFDGEFFQLDEAVIVPVPEPAIPIVIGGRSDAAVRRTGRYGDGWLASWVSPERFAAVTAEVADIASSHQRKGVRWRHGLQTWCGVGASPERARTLVATAMSDFYRVPFEAFEKYTPYGTPAQIVDRLRPYLEAGCTTFNLTPIGSSSEEQVEAVGEIAEALRGA